MTPLLRGTIDRVLQDRGFCFIRDEHRQEYFAHRSAIVPRDAFAVLAPGMRVRFEATGSNRGLRAVRVVIERRE
jgi:cold shock CspA family protein